MCKYLRDRIQESVQRGYHQSPVSTAALLRARLVQDSAWAQDTEERRELLRSTRHADGTVSRSFFPNRYS
jgi:hypothetical protein